VPRPKGSQAVVRIHNTNTKKIIVSRFVMDGEEAAVSGDMAIDGVAGTGSPIRLEFLSPGAYRQAPPYGAGHRSARCCRPWAHPREPGGCGQSGLLRAGRGGRHHRHQEAEGDRRSSKGSEAPPPGLTVEVQRLRTSSRLLVTAAIGRLLRRVLQLGAENHSSA
jgi:hypothetical protein